MGLIKGIRVRLYKQIQTGVDGFGAPVYAEIAETVENVLVYPATADDIITSTDLYGKKAVYNLCIPKGDAHKWEDKKVSFFGQAFKTFGPVKEYIPHLVPLKWNKQIQVERYE